MDNTNSVDHQSMNVLVSAKTMDNSLKVDTTYQKLIKYSTEIIHNIWTLRKYEHLFSQPLSQSKSSNLCAFYNSIVAKVFFNICNMQMLKKQSSIHDIFSFIIKHSAKFISDIPPITFAEINAVYKTYLSIYSLRTQQIPSLSSNYSRSNKNPPLYVNHSCPMVQNPPRTMPLQSVSLKSPQQQQQLTSLISTKKNVYSGINGITSNASLNPAYSLKGLAPSTVSTAIFSNSQLETLKSQILTYQEIYFRNNLELKKYQNMMCHEFLRRLKQQKTKKLQQRLLNSTNCHNSIIEKKQQQRLINKQVHRMLHDNNNLHPQPQLKLIRLTSPDRNLTKCDRIAARDDLLQSQRSQVASFESSKASTVVNTTAVTSKTEVMPLINDVISALVNLENERKFKNNIDSKNDKGNEIKLDEKPQMKEDEIDTKNIKKEAIAISEMKDEKKTSETKYYPPTIDLVEDNKNSVFCDMKNNQDKMPELLTFNDNPIDDDYDFMLNISSHKDTIIPVTNTKIEEIKYNQASINEELECEVLCKELGIQVSSSNQNTLIEGSGVPVINSVRTIDNYVFEHLNDIDNNTLMNDDIINTNDMTVKLECNKRLPHSNFSEIDEISFVGEIIQESVPRPNCFNCKLNEGKIVCECGEIVYCSHRCVEIHWFKFHSNFCKGPSIDEITLDN